MNRSVQQRKNLVRWILAVVLVADVVLVFVNLRTTPSAQARSAEIQQLEVQRELLKADVNRASEIRRGLPNVQRQIDQFFADELRDASTGYSSVENDLNALARQSGLRTESVTFRQHEVTGRHVVEVEVNAAVAGDYPSLVKFINGLERSKNFYVLDSLSLASITGPSPTLRLNLRLRTYFRSRA